MHPRTRNELILGLFVLAALATLAWLYRALSGGDASDGRILYAAFADVAGLVPDNEVAVAGVRVGRVRAIRLEQGRAVVELSVAGDLAVSQSARATVRARSLLGEKYLDLAPGEGPPLPDGGRIERTAVAADAGSLPAEVAPLVPEVGRSLSELARLLESANAAAGPGGERLLDLARESEQAARRFNRLLELTGPKAERAAASLEAATSALSHDLPGLIERSERLLARLEELAAAFPAETLRQVPDTWARVDRAATALEQGMTSLRDSSGRLDRIAANLDVILDRLAKVDELAVRRFLQTEGVNVNLFQGSAGADRIRELERQRQQREEPDGD